ncbi:hypothetical protein BDM02DRAFT_3126950 [Thelephora ganbajun]|uniref:Uncharacterized protein n=1 Tax=Thelephora ganbajun TaxID=370292 RepID=A0ACB6ZQ81_THEGA|nr:hypothetical protein BDM02DRAFT_3126950 [Thelephora ganbajun]
MRLGSVLCELTLWAVFLFCLLVLFGFRRQALQISYPEINASLPRPLSLRQNLDYPSRRMSSSANSVDTDSSSMSRQDNKRPYTPDSPPPVLAQNKRQRVSLDSSAADDRVQLPPIHSLRDHHLADSRRASLPTLYSENPARLPKSYPATNGVAPVRSPYHHSPSLTSYQFPSALDQEDKFRPRLDTSLSSPSFNPYTSYPNSSTPNSSFPSSFNFTSPPPSQPGPQSANGYLNSTHSWSAPSPHLTRPNSNPDTDRHPASKSEEQLDSWAFPQYTQSNSLANGSKHPTPLNPISPLPAPAAAMAERPKGKRGKLPKPVTDYLKDWLHRHSDHPYPSEDEKKQLCQATGLSMSQVSNWMINARRRILAPAQRAQANATGSSSPFRTPSASDPLLSDPTLNPHHRHHPNPQQHLHPSSYRRASVPASTTDLQIYYPMTLQSIPTPAASLQISRSLPSHQNSSTSQSRLSISSDLSNPPPGLLGNYGLSSNYMNGQGGQGHRGGNGDMYSLSSASDSRGYTTYANDPNEGDGNSDLTGTPTSRSAATAAYAA